MEQVPRRLEHGEINIVVYKFLFYNRSSLSPFPITVGYSASTVNVDELKKNQSGTHKPPLMPPRQERRAK